MSQYTDKELFELTASGDEQAFTRLFYRYGPGLHSFVLGMVKKEALASEIVQDVFLRLWQNRETLTAIDQPSSWMYRIASNLTLTWFRRQQIELKVLNNIGKRTADRTESLTETLDARELNSLIGKAVHNLPSQRKKIFILTRQEGMSRREVAVQLGISENTVKNQLAIALKSIQKYIELHSGFYLPAIFFIALDITCQ